MVGFESTIEFNYTKVVPLQYNQCAKLGPNVCLPVYYEQLVLHPKKWMYKILNFLGVSWNETVLHHEKHIDNGDISLSKY